MSIADKYGDVFRQEAEERLAEMEEVILIIEGNPDDIDATVHSQNFTRFWGWAGG